MAHFDESSGVVSCKTNWGRWWQTMEDVCIEVDLEEGTTSKLVQCQIKPKCIKVVVKGQIIIEVYHKNPNILDRENYCDCPKHFNSVVLTHSNASERYRRNDCTV